MRERALGHWLVAIVACLLAAQAAAADSPPRDEVVYTIKQGDTLIGIANSQMIESARWRELRALNRVPNDRRLKPGATLRIPAEWMRQSAAQALVVRSDGDVNVDGRVPQAGEPLAEGARIQTGERGSLSLRLADGASVIVQPRTSLLLAYLRTLEASGAARARIRLDQGRVENAVTPQRKPGALFEVQTPAAVAGVRGTKYRVADLEGDALAEVLEGVVGVVGAAADAGGTELKSGFGVRVSAAGQVAAPVALLPAPNLAGLPALQERPLVRFRVPPLPAAVRYRAQVAPDVSFQAILQESVTESPELRFVGLPDGEYALRLRGIDVSGLEGLDAVLAFRLKARPEPPFPASPADGGKIRGQTLQLRWTAAAEADHYVLQVASDAAFRNIVVEAAEVRETSHSPTHAFTPGKYAWRIASVRADGDRGPWSDPAAFEVLPPPAAPEPPAIDDDKIVLRWAAEPGQRFLFQMARDAQFANMHVERKLDQPTITLPRPQPGSYFVRVQATDPDGFVGPFTATQRIDVPEPPPSPWLFLFLLPLLSIF
ncbi:MAG: FecR domain-containing protein [Burkholderiales bacterium]|nr:FecR domain-containing protein [Burkholderiales bacterium]